MMEGPRHQHLHQEWQEPLEEHNGGQVLIFVVGAFAEMSEDVSRICDIIAHNRSSSGSCHSWCGCWWRGPSIILPFSLHRT